MSAPALDVREHGLLFSAPMIRALLDDTKTQTRRVLTDRNTCGNFKAGELDLSRAWVDPGPSPAGNPGPYLKSYLTPAAAAKSGDAPDSIVERLYPRYHVGDLIWGRETWAAPVGRSGVVAFRADGECGAFMGDGDEGRLWIRHGGVVHPDIPPRSESWRGESYGLGKFGGRWRPSIHMPRRLSRITRVLTAVRIERVQEIRRTDVEAEGIDMVRDGWQWKEAYRALWDSLNGKRNGGVYSWEANPWVIALTFARVTP